MLNLEFVEKSQEIYFHHILCMLFQEKCFSCHILLTDQISLFDCLYFCRYWEICVLHLFASQVSTWPESQDKNLNIFEKEKSF